MGSLNFAKQKISLAQIILALNDENIVNQIQLFVVDLLEDFEGEAFDYDANKLTFEEWNNQFEDDISLDESLPEYGITLLEFRKKIYNAEKQEGLSKEEFFEKVKNLK